MYLRSILSTLLLGSLLVPLGLGTIQGSRADDALSNVLADWNERQKLMNTVHYVVSGHGLYPKTRLDRMPAALGVHRPSADHAFPISLELSVDFENRVLSKIKTYDKPHQGKYVTTKEKRIFDGQEATTRQYANTVEADALIVQPGSYVVTLGGFLEPSDYPMLFACGVVPTSYANIDLRSLRREYRTGDFRLYGTASHAGRTCLVLRTPPRNDQSGLYHEFWIDTSRKSAVVKWVVTTRGQTSALAEIEHKEVNGVWLPDAWKVNTYFIGMPDEHELSLTQQFQCMRVEWNVPFDKSRLDLGQVPGMTVVDAKTSSLYKVGTDGKARIPFIADQPLPERSVWKDEWHVIVIITAVALVLLGVMLYRACKRRAARATG